ncbi:MAG: hypothetical protein NTZ19_16205 [Bacteroidetes bacterium]|nr:hypothetical protein [Bacteroidota bacterium]
MRNCVLCFALLFIMLSCKNKKAGKTEKVSSDSTKYFALGVFFQQQIVDVDLRAYHIYLVKNLNGKKDSLEIDKEIFKSYANLFLQKDISAPEMHNRFSETVFHDLSTKSYTLNYRAKSVDEPIQNIDILLDENTSIVKRVFVRTETMHKDTSIVEQCNWKADKSFQINRVSKTPSGYISNEFNYINWNDHKK